MRVLVRGRRRGILTLLRVRNTGIAFSLFAGSGFGLIVLPLAVTAIVLVFWAYNREGGRPAAAGLEPPARSAIATVSVFAR